MDNLSYLRQIDAGVVPRQGRAAERGETVDTSGGGVGRFVGLTPSGIAWICYEGSESGTFRNYCRRFDRLYPNGDCCWRDSHREIEPLTYEEFKGKVVDGVHAKIGGKSWYRGVCLDSLAGHFQDYGRGKDLVEIVDSVSFETELWDAT